MLDKPATEAQKVIEAFVRGYFPAGSIHAVEVIPDPYEDGENYLQVTLEVGRGFSKKNIEKMLGLIRHLRPLLAEVNEFRFPVVQYPLRKRARSVRHKAG